TTDLAKDLGSSVVSSVGSIFEPIEVYAAIIEVDVEGGILKFNDQTGSITGSTGAIEHLVIPEVIEGIKVRTIDKNAFKDKTSLRSITLPSNLNTIGESAFNGCTSLKTINIPDENELDTIGTSAFSGCTGLERVVIPTGVTTISSSVFYDCIALKSISLPNSLTGIGASAFRGCKALTSIIIPNKVTSLGNYAFYGCTSLVDVKLPNSLTSIGEHAFEYCRSLVSITIPNSVTSLGTYVFSNCTGLQDVVLSTKLTSIPDRTFNDCNNLVNLTIPAINGIGSYAFWETNALRNIYYGGSNDDWDSINKQYTAVQRIGNYQLHTNSKMPETPEETPLLFDDIYLDSYFTSAIEYMIGKGFMGGKTASTFDPLANLTRAELVTILYNSEGKPSVGTSSFSDLAGHWASDAVTWANENGLVNGKTETTFDPEGTLIKQDLAAILQRYYNYKGLNLSTSNSTTVYDSNKADEYAQNNINELAKVGIIDSNVLSDGNYEPKEKATRAEATYLMYNLLNN
ncbi:MAG: leucine-rich repeat protein, partial [bacterium]